MEQELLGAWDIHNRVHLYLLNAIPGEALAARAGGKGRTVGAMFAHIHNVRLLWLKASAPDLLAGREPIQDATVGDAATLGVALSGSATAIRTLLERSYRSGQRVKGFKPTTTAFLSYLIAHESHHRGEIGVALSLSGQPLSRKIDFGLWEWGVR